MTNVTALYVFMKGLDYLFRKEQKMRKSRKKQLTAIVMAVMMVCSLFTGIGTVQVDAATIHKSGTVSPTDLKVGDSVYKGVQLNSNREITVCKECKMIWIEGDPGYADSTRSQVARSSAHSA